MPEISDTVVSAAIVHVQVNPATRSETNRGREPRLYCRTDHGRHEHWRKLGDDLKTRSIIAHYAKGLLLTARSPPLAKRPLDEEEHLVNPKLIVQLAEENQLPAIYPFKEFVQAGGLMSYGVDLTDVGRHVADMVGKILKGAKPGQIPIFQPTKFELVINLKTAKALGLTVPPHAACGRRGP